MAPRPTSDAPPCTSPVDPLLKLQHAAELLDATPRWLREQISLGRIEGFRLAGDRQVRVKASDIARLAQPIPAVAAAS